MKHVLYYLEKAIDLEILYKIILNDKNLIIFADAFYTNSCKFRSTISFCILILNESVIWISHKQQIIIQSTTKSEYIILTDVIKQAIWLHHFLYAIEKSEIYKKKIIIVYRDNINFLNLIANSVFHSRIKHIQIQYHAIQDYIERNKIQIQYVQINEMLADNLIKALDHIKFKQMIKELDLTN